MTPTDAELARVASIIDGRKNAAADLRAKAQRAITTLAARGQVVNIQTVAQKAGCTTGYLYKHPDLADRIKELRDGQPTKEKAQPGLVPSTERSLQTKIEAAVRRNRQLEKEVTRLRSENRNLLAKVLANGL